ncbi:hypothetical protein BDF20DRAFT_62664 [Mycotypha africana]|uniref:uncharacterized protein n=1 Tax=Mycotypha africana TaxID=64632 RepID=UPI002301B6F8|nr:uncharacterized protein BDF20DRAFT_62664 [Mycotypha africana]KAI8991794.1 hypothetical protein BDF20DRAFT_62664 [Mycotypha africana]
MTATTTAMPTTTDKPEDIQVFEAFNKYPWESDNVFQQGLESILNQLNILDQKESDKEEKDLELYQDLQLLKAKHFYFTRFQQQFDLEQYLTYETEKADLKKTEPKPSEEDQENLFQRLENYDYENDVEYSKGLPNIIKGWIAQQSKTGLWDKEKLDTEFAKTKAFFYNARVEKVDLLSYFKWRAKREQANAPACPFANLWQNKLSAGPTDQTNSATFVIVEKPKEQRFGPALLTLSSPKSKNLFSLDRLEELSTALQEVEKDDRVTAIFINARVADDGAMDPFVGERMIETKDTKVWSNGLAYEETSKMVAGADLRQVSLCKLASQYYDNVRSFLSQKQQRQPEVNQNDASDLENKTEEEKEKAEAEQSKGLSADRKNKPIITFCNGEIFTSAAYLSLGPGLMRVITEFTLLNFTLQLSHAPMPPLLLLAVARARAKALAATHNSNEKMLIAGLELYLALAAPAYGKLRGPELLRLGFADAFVPEAKLKDAIDTAKKLAVCPVGDGDETTVAAVQLALAIHHTYPGPDRMQVWKDQIESTFGKAESFDDLRLKLEEIDSLWSKNLLAYWNTLPPLLLNVVYEAVNKTASLNPLEILDLEQKLNAKWCETDDYKTWLKHKSSQDQSTPPSWIVDKEQVSTMVKLFFEGPSKVEGITVEPVIYKAPQEAVEENKIPSGICPVTGQAAANEAVCPVTGQKGGSFAPSISTASVCPVTGQVAVNEAVCPVTGQKGGSISAANVCPVTSHALSSASSQDNAASEPL